MNTHDLHAHVTEISKMYCFTLPALRTCYRWLYWKAFYFTFTFRRSSFWLVWFLNVFLPSTISRNCLEYRCFLHILDGELAWKCAMSLTQDLGAGERMSNQRHSSTEVNNFVGNICLKTGKTDIFTKSMISAFIFFSSQELADLSGLKKTS